MTEAMFLPVSQPHTPERLLNNHREGGNCFKLVQSTVSNHETHSESQTLLLIQDDMWYLVYP